jgi:hypothetical protein
VAISAEPGGSCELACFHVRSSKDVGFIAIDSVACFDARVELSLARLDESGAETPLQVTPYPHGNGKSCADVPASAMKFDDLTGRHLLLCAAGARSAGVYVKSGRTCAAQAFEIAPLLHVSAAVEPSGCNLTTHFETWNVVDAGGTPIDSYTCHWTFDDGGTSDLCTGEHTFASPGFHSGTVIVSQVGTSAFGTRTTPEVPIWDELEIDVVAEAPECGLSFEYVLDKTGGRPTGGFYFVSVSPAENVLTEHPGGWPISGTIEVSSPGTYTITAYREEETSFSLCTASATTEVRVTACP